MLALVLIPVTMIDDAAGTMKARIYGAQRVLLLRYSVKVAAANIYKQVVNGRRHSKNYVKTNQGFSKQWDKHDSLELFE